MVGKKPDKKPFGRDGPPKGYPTDQSVYADPENWRYPLHTSWHASAARRYFDEATNRNKYSKEEQAFIDSRINEALNKTRSTRGPARPARNAPSVFSSAEVEAMSLEDLLRVFLGAPRFQRAKQMDDSLVSIARETSNVVEGTVKEYFVKIDLPNRTIMHNCQDWSKNLDSKNMCKHLGRLMLSLDDGKAKAILKQVLEEKDRWSFVVPESD